MNARELLAQFNTVPRADHKLAQGTPEWHQFRAGHYGASEAAAMLGLSKYTTRSDLLRQKYTGDGKEASSELQAVFDKGHAAEAMARPIVEKLIGQELYPLVCSRGSLSASCDGLTMDDSIAFEHKQYSKDLFAAVQAGVLPDEHWPQCQQVLMVTGAERLYFACSDGTEDNFAGLWVEPNEEQQARILAGWGQFDADFAGYKVVDVAPSAVAANIETLPALTINLTGEVTSSNLAEFEAVVVARIKAIKTDLQDDQDFADAEKMTGFLKSGEEKLALTKEQALAQTASIAELFSTVDRISGEMRTTRLKLEKLVAARKDGLREEIRLSGATRYAAHIKALNERIGRSLLDTRTQPAADFAGAMKGKRNFASMRDAVDTELARVTIESNALADRLQMNIKAVDAVRDEYGFLFSDENAICFKQADDLAMLIKSRIADHKAAEAKRLEAEREKIRQEEAAKLEAAQKAAAQVAATPPPAQIDAGTAVMPATQPAQRSFVAGPRPTPAEDALRASIVASLHDLTLDELRQVDNAIKTIHKSRTEKQAA